MKSAMRAFLVVALALGLNAGAAAPAVESNNSTPLQQMMGGSFQAVARILAALIEVRYESIPVQAEILIQHADELIATPPAGLQNDGERVIFISYATNLSTAAKRLKAMAEGLSKNDRPHASPVKMITDEQRANAAQRMGEIVSACTVCHGQFRFNGTANQ